MGKVNFAQLKRDIANNPDIQKEMEKLARKTVSESQKNAIVQFNNHPITKEIEAGPGANNSSGTLTKGNLFSFIGFFVDSNPISIVRNVWTQIYFRGLRKTTIKSKEIIYSYSVTVPSPKDFKDNSKIPWAKGRSFLVEIAKGISGMGAYIYKRGRGRSKGGVQTKKPSGATSKPVDYFAPIYNKFTSIFRSPPKF